MHDDQQDLATVPTIAAMEQLRAQLAEAHEVLQAIAHHAVDAFVIQGVQGEQIFTLKGAEHVYRVIMETINEGAATLGNDGTVLYCNRAFASLLQLPLHRVIGTLLAYFVVPEDLAGYTQLVKGAAAGSSRGEVCFQTGQSLRVPVLLSCSSLHLDDVQGICLVATDLTEQKNQADTLVRANQRLQQEMAERRQVEIELTEVRRRISQSQEQERLSLARELHAGPIQELMGLDLGLEMLAQDLLSDQEITQVHTLSHSVRQLSQQLRALAETLRPPVLSDLGLAEAMRAYAYKMQELHATPPIAFHLTKQRCSLPEEINLMLYRIYQQAVQNAIRHGQAGQIHVRLRTEQERLWLEIEDDGQGFIIPGSWVELTRQGHLGLAGMAERAASVGGQFDVISGLSLGTTVRVNIALPKD